MTGNLVVSGLNQSSISSALVTSVFIFTVGIALTHLHRAVIHQYRWTELAIPKLIPLVVVSSAVLSVCFLLLGIGLRDVMDGRWPYFAHDWWGTSWKNLFVDGLNFTILFILWNILYFSAHTFENWKREEISNLELRAAKVESELQSFRAQMNPHFLFNSLNSIRALVDEDPSRAREALLMLSTILRNNMLPAKHAVVPLKDELTLVEKYLALETIRFEERLNTKLHVSQDAMGRYVPPFMLQTLIENAVKHGISQSINGGQVQLQAEVEGTDLIIEIRNTGALRTAKSTDGIGVQNTRQRLHLLYQGRAAFHLFQDGEMVCARLRIPQNQPI